MTSERKEREYNIKQEKTIYARQRNRHKANGSQTMNGFKTEKG